VGPKIIKGEKIKKKKGELTKVALDQQTTTNQVF
jgi:hypothetical protein